jgi:peptidoglycan/xylan/chitin deacetylase (PgdA/CDA1 family)
MFTLLLAALLAAAEPFQLAVTVDDLPRHGPDIPGLSRLQIHQKMLAAFARHRLPPVYGFVNAGKAQDAGDRAALQAWLDAGHKLGSHTWSHPDQRRLSVEEYTRDVDRNEPLLRELVPDESWKVFRFPFLEQGVTLGARRAIRRHLDARGYRIAEVTIDFYDWAYNPPHARCLQTRDDAAIEALRKSYLAWARATAEWAIAAGKSLHKRPIPHVVLLHVGAFGAEMMDELLSLYEKLGAQFVTLDLPLADPAYQGESKVAPSRGYTWLEQQIEDRGAPHPPWIPLPAALLSALCPVKAP